MQVWLIEKEHQTHYSRGGKFGGCLLTGDCICMLPWSLAIKVVSNVLWALCRLCWRALDTMTHTYIYWLYLHMLSVSSQYSWEVTYHRVIRNTASITCSFYVLVYLAVYWWSLLKTKTNESCTSVSVLHAVERFHHCLFSFHGWQVMLGATQSGLWPSEWWRASGNLVLSFSLI